jgi:hypothetical protein
MILKINKIGFDRQNMSRSQADFTLFAVNHKGGKNSKTKGIANHKKVILQII